jgi:hypothetical protein
MARCPLMVNNPEGQRMQPPFEYVMRAAPSLAKYIGIEAGFLLAKVDLHLLIYTLNHSTYPVGSYMYLWLYSRVGPIAG